MTVLITDHANTVKKPLDNAGKDLLISVTDRRELIVSIAARSDLTGDWRC